jgi:cell division protein FtsB
MRTTKQQLQQEVEALRAECDRLRTENAALRSRSAAVPTKQRPKFIVSPEEEARRAEIRRRMDAARAEAMRTGRTVKV